mgnify:CR=1 FL=1
MARWKAIALIMIGALCYGTLSPLVKIALQQGFMIQDISSSSIVFGCFVLWILTIPVLADLKKYSYKTIGVVISVGSVLGLTEVFYMLTLAHIPASLAVVLLFQFTWMTQIVHMIQTRKGLSKSRWIAVGCILIGTYFASGAMLSQLFQSNTLGIVFGLLSALTYTISVFVSAAVGTHMNQLVRSSLMLTGQMVFVLMVFSPTFSFVKTVAAGLWKWAGLLGLIGFVVTTYAYNKAIPYIGVSLAGVLGSIELPMVILLSAVVLRESISATQWLGVGLILLGIVIADYSGLSLLKRRIKS